MGGGAEYAKKVSFQDWRGGEAGSRLSLIIFVFVIQRKGIKKKTLKIIKMKYLDKCEVLLIFTSTWPVMEGGQGLKQGSKFP